MKRVIAVIILFIACFSYVCFAESDNTARFGYAPMVAANYIQWGKVYKISDIKMDYYYSPDDDSRGEKTLYIDDLAIVFSNNDLQTRWIVLFYMDKNTDALAIVNQWKRVSSLYSAIEYGDPNAIDSKTIAEAEESSDIFLTEMNSAMNNSRDDLYSGKYITFHTSNKGIYSISYLPDEEQWLVSVL